MLDVLIPVLDGRVSQRGWVHQAEGNERTFGGSGLQRTGLVIRSMAASCSPHQRKSRVLFGHHMILVVVM